MFRLICVCLLTVPLCLLTVTHAAPAPPARNPSKPPPLDVLEVEARSSILRDRQPSWIGDFYGSDRFLTEADKETFARPLNVQRGEIIHLNRLDRGYHNLGLYNLAGDYKGHPASTAVVKILPGPTDRRAWGEVKALQAVGQYIDSGLLQPENQLAIVMKKVEGEIITYTKTWAESDATKKKELLNQMKVFVKKQFKDWVHEKGMAYVDFSYQNILVSFDSKGTIQSWGLVDLGYFGVFKVKSPDTVTDGQIDEFFEKQWRHIMKVNNLIVDGEIRNGSATLPGDRVIR
ncbi:hypothetical protein C8J55DRAFT_510897 [Lentinula edodes]|uniref:Protein kinase domain-containing protein n=1 Tax=Lentinula lateritia TaxID=40482 RepID=A0A9W9DS87_9AGAR|nr:hypothetical protein C8J55DRAFT_510897 [Lentinula edodes]